MAGKKGRLGKSGITPYKRFMAKVRRPPDDGLEHCWLWTAARGGRGNGKDPGHGQFFFNGKQGRSHIFAYETYWGKVPQGLHVLHTCDIRECVNPFHLIAGTQKENCVDAQQKGRMLKKLTPEDREDIVKSTEPSPSLARRYGITKEAVNYIRRCAGIRQVIGSRGKTIKLAVS